MCALRICSTLLVAIAACGDPPGAASGGAVVVDAGVATPGASPEAGVAPVVDASAPVAPDAATPGCAKPHAPGTSTLSLSSGGQPRSARLVVPPAYDGARRLPVMLLFHGSGGSGAAIADTTKLAALAASRGFLLVAPDAALRVGSSGPFWNIPGVPLTDGTPIPPGAPSDVDFVRGLLDQLDTDLCVDDARVHAVGFSGGARFASTLACAIPDRIASIATASGLRFPDGCAPARPVPVIAFHARDDATNPYEGGPPPPYWTYGVLEAVNRWSRRDGCPSAPAVTDAGPGLSTSTWSPCNGGADVILHVSATGGHAWPTSPADANDQIWSFLDGHARP